VGNHLKFGEALEHLRDGLKVTRTAWNTGLAQESIPSSTYVSLKNTMDSVLDLPFFVMRTPRGSFVYMFTIEDILATDWLTLDSRDIDRLAIDQARVDKAQAAAEDAAASGVDAGVLDMPEPAPAAA
jgi:hypothetical protein